MNFEPTPLPRGTALHAFTHRAMNCDWGILIADLAASDAAPAARAAFEEVDRLERDLSRFVGTSDITRLNSAPPGVPMRVGPAAWDCLSLAAELWRTTLGAFDVTIGAALLAGKRASPPSLGMQHLRLDADQRAATLLLPGLVIDLGAIGKGYAVDAAADVLRDWGVASALVHSGQSTIYALGALGPASGWQIDIRNPLDHSQAVGHVVLRNGAFSGSGVRLHGPHIIDPRTGTPAVGRCGAWALAPSAAVSDAISTAFMILSEPEIARICEAQAHYSALIATEESARINLRSFGHGWYLD